MPPSPEEQDYVHMRRYSIVRNKRYTNKQTTTVSIAVWSKLFALSKQQQFITFNYWRIKNREWGIWCRMLVMEKRNSPLRRCLENRQIGLRRTIVSCLLFSTAFLIQSASAQNSKNPILRNETISNFPKKKIRHSAIQNGGFFIYNRLQQSQLGSPQKLELNLDSRQKNQAEIFGSQVLTDRVRYSHRWILVKVGDGKSNFPEFLPMSRRVETELGESNQQKNNPHQLFTIEEKKSATTNLLTESLKSDKYQDNISEDTTPDSGNAENLGIVEVAPRRLIDFQVGQQDSATPDPKAQEVDDILKQLEAIPKQQSLPFPAVSRASRLSPAFTISNPNGYGADNFNAFISASYQRRTRFTTISDGEMGFGIGLGNAVKAVGVELAYTLNTFGTTQEFGSGSFSIKVHRRIAEDMSIAIGWNQFADIVIGDDVTPFDFPENSYYAVVTKIFNTQKYINAPFSRVAITAGIGGGQFLDFDRINEAALNDEEPSGLGVFGSLGVRVLQPISVIVEWSGQDLGIGLSIVPFKNIPIIITPAIRDISGAGDGARFIMGTGISIKL